MNEFWDVLTDRDLQELEPRDLPYAGTRGMVRRFRRRIRPKRRSVYRALAAAAAMALLSLGVWAGYTSWRMPDEAEPYTGDRSRCMRKIPIRWTRTPGCMSRKRKPAQMGRRLGRTNGF